MSRKHGVLIASSLVCIAFSRGLSIAQSDVFFFVRGDANLDSRLDVSDAVLILTALFVDNAPLVCSDAADANDDGAVTITDAIRVLQFLFSGNVPPSSPFPETGIDPTEDALDCLATSGGGLEPPRRVTARDAEEALAAEEIARAGAEAAALPVSAETYDALATLQPGASLFEIQDRPGVQELMEALVARTAPAGAPIAVPFHLTVPYPEGGCYTIDPAKLKGHTRDVGPEATPDADLVFDVEPRAVCGPGAHVVKFQVTDGQGLSSWADSLVSICEPGRDCKESAIDPAGGLPSFPTESITCAWIESRHVIPRQPVRSDRSNRYNDEGWLAAVDTERPFAIGTDPMEVVLKTAGAGPSHSLVAMRSSPLCNTPATDLAVLGWGQLIVRINLLCFSASDCRIVERPPCTDRVDLEGSYEGSVSVRTDSGESCRPGGNPVEALAQEEANLQINGSSVFSKALAVQNGAMIRKQVKFEVSTNIGTTGVGLAANIQTTHGLTHEIWSRTGSRRGALRAFGVHQTKSPVTAELTAEGKAELTGEASASGLAGAGTEAAALYALGTTNCPGAGTLLIVEAFGRGEALAQALGRVEDFVYQHTGRRLEIEPR